MRGRFHSQSGITLVELIIAIMIMAMLATSVVPVVAVGVRREKERQLRRAVWEMRDAIDRYKDAADKGNFETEIGSEGYPPDLETLVNGVNEGGGRKVRFLRRIPVDPMTHKAEWGMHSVTDDPDSDSWGGQNLFDVYSKSDGTALDGTKYREW